jgi:uncharacterized DUF497 family protein
MRSDLGAMRFTWDPRKEVANHRKHGVSFKEAASAFADPLSVSIFDELHSSDESRMLLLGMSSRQRLLVISYVEHQEDDLRIISARQATHTERRNYEEDLP